MVDDFDANTPPPRRRPIGDPVPPFVTLPPGEPVIETFEQWDRTGRIPARSILCNHVGTACGMVAGSGYGFVTFALGHPDAVRFAMRAGDLVPNELLDGYRVAVVIQEAKQAPRFAVMSPM